MQRVKKKKASRFTFCTLSKHTASLPQLYVGIYPVVVIILSS